MIFNLKNTLALLFTITGLVSLKSQSYADSLLYYYEDLAALRAQEQKILNRIEYLRRNVDFSRIGLYSIPKDEESGSEKVEHAAMILKYDEGSEGPLWVSHIIYPNEEGPRAKRKNNFRMDKKVSSQTVGNAEYKALNASSTSSKYDRGHMAPSADFSWWQRAMDESFYYSNISPQVSGLNRNKWRILEEELREYADRTGHLLYVATGPVFTGIIENPLANSELDVPGAYFKVVVDPLAKRGIGFILPNEAISTQDHLINYFFSIDDVEALTGIDFFSAMEDRLEFFVETDRNPLAWLSSSEVGIIPQSYLSAGLRNTENLDLLLDNGKTYTICSGVDKIVENTKSYTLYLPTEYESKPLTISIPKDIAESISPNFKNSFDGRYVFVKGKVISYRGKPRVQVRYRNQFGFFMPD